MKRPPYEFIFGVACCIYYYMSSILSDVYEIFSLLGDGSYNLVVKNIVSKHLWIDKQFN